MKKTFVCADIHGHLEPLIELLNKVNFDDNDKLILLGDLCDRGPDTYELIEFLMKIKNLVLIKGNHDYYFQQYLKGNEWFIHNWGSKKNNTTIESYNKNKWLNKEKHLEFINNALPIYIENNICFVHGGFNRFKLISEQTEDEFINNRQLIIDVMSNEDSKIYTKDNFDRIFIGHTPTICWNKGDEKLDGELKIVLSIEDPISTPIIKSSVYNIDTGCGKGGPLTIYDVYNDVYYQSKYKYKRIRIY
jgi:serine/threonine protein phosphatase 1